MNAARGWSGAAVMGATVLRPQRPQRVLGVQRERKADLVAAHGLRTEVAEGMSGAAAHAACHVVQLHVARRVPHFEPEPLRSVAPFGPVRTR